MDLPHVVFAHHAQVVPGGEGGYGQHRVGAELAARVQKAVAHPIVGHFDGGAVPKQHVEPAGIATTGVLVRGGVEGLAAVEGGELGVVLLVDFGPQRAVFHLVLIRQQVVFGPLKLQGAADPE